MSSLNDLHDQAMELADDADQARRQGADDKANLLFKRAYEIELQAARRIDHEPSRSVMYRSVAALALEAGLFEEARSSALNGLAGQPTAEIHDELQSIIEEVDLHNLERGL